MTNDPVARRITELAEAFRAFQGTVPGLTVEVVGHVADEPDLVHPTAGFHVRIPESGRPGGVDLYVSAHYAELTRWGDVGAMRERFIVLLEDAFEWGDSIFPDASGLAHDLLAYMQFNLDVLASR